MVRREGYWGSYLLYGPGGGGKTNFLVSSFWDVKQQKMLARGKLITFGREDNPFLMVPEACRQTEGGVSLRFTAPALDVGDRAWLDRFDKYTRVLLDQTRKRDVIDVLGIDGLSEFDMLYESTFASQGDTFAKFNALMDEFFAIMQRLDPNELGCHVIVTARVRERARGTKGEESLRAAKEKAGVSEESNPFDYFPAVRGGFKEWLPHYFNNVFYVHTRKPSTPDGVPAHVVQVLTLGDYLTKLQAEHQWLERGYPKELVNTDFYSVQHRLEDILGVPHILPKEVEN